MEGYGAWGPIALTGDGLPTCAVASESVLCGERAGRARCLLTGRPIAGPFIRLRVQLNEEEPNVTAATVDRSSSNMRTHSGGAFSPFLAAAPTAVKATRVATLERRAALQWHLLCPLGLLGTPSDGSNADPYL